MPSSSAKLASYDAVRSVPFKQIHGCPTRQHYELLKKEASDLASKVDNLTFAWSHDPATGEEYGILPEIIGNVEYVHLINQTWILPVEPTSYDPGITAAKRHAKESAWKKNGKRNKNPGTSEKVSFAESQ
jgi:hypothetical protein